MSVLEGLSIVARPIEAVGIRLVSTVRHFLGD
jgi:hypothetical protein